MEGFETAIILIAVVLVGVEAGLGIGLCFGSINPTKWKKGLLTATAAYWGLALGAGIGLIFSNISLYEINITPLIICPILGVVIFPILTYYVPGVNRFVVGFLVTMKLTSILMGVILRSGGMGEDIIMAMIVVPLVVGIIGGVVLAAWTSMKVSAFIYACAFIGAAQLAPLISEMIGYLQAAVTGDISYAFDLFSLIELLLNIEIADIWIFLSMIVLIPFGIKRQWESLKKQKISPDTPLIVFETTSEEEHGKTYRNDGKDGQVQSNKTARQGRTYGSVKVENFDDDGNFLEDKINELKGAKEKWDQFEHPLKEAILKDKILFAIPIVYHFFLNPLIGKYGITVAFWYVDSVLKYCVIACFVYAVYNCSKWLCAVWPAAYMISYVIMWNAALFQYPSLIQWIQLFAYFAVWLLTAFIKKNMKLQIIGSMVSLMITILVFEILLEYLFCQVIFIDIGYILSVFAAMIATYILQKYYGKNLMEDVSRKTVVKTFIFCIALPLVIGIGCHWYFMSLYSDEGEIGSQDAPNGIERESGDEETNYIGQEWANADYIFPNSDTQILTSSDLEGLTDDQLRIARNEIFARKGRLFSETNLQEYFDSKSWYYGEILPEDFDEMSLSDIERDNIRAIQYQEGDLIDVMNRSFKMIGMTYNEIEDKYGYLLNGAEQGYPGSGGNTPYAVGDTGLYAFFSDDDICTTVEGLPSAFFYNVGDDLTLEALSEILEREIQVSGDYDYIEVSDGNWMIIDYNESQGIMWIYFTEPKR